MSKKNYDDAFWIETSQKDIETEIKQRAMQGMLGNGVVGFLLLSVIYTLIWYFNEVEIAELFTVINLGISFAVLFIFSISGYFTGKTRGEKEQRDKIFPIITVKKIEETNNLLKDLISKIDSKDEEFTLDEEDLKK